MLNEPNRFSSFSKREVIRNPDKTKKMSTPNPPLRMKKSSGPNDGNPDVSEQCTARTPAMETARRPSRPGSRPWFVEEFTTLSFDRDSNVSTFTIMTDQRFRFLALRHSFR